MATVITNLLSAIPYFGQDLVESTHITEYFTIIENVLLPTIGIIHKNAIKKGNKEIRSILNKKEYLSIPSSFVAFLAGIIDGDGYIQITRTTKGFIAIKLVIQIHLDDLSTLEYIHSVLKLGKIKINRDHKSPNCKLIINRTDLQEVLFPLFLHHQISFLTLNRLTQFNLAVLIFKENIKLYDLIPIKKSTIDQINKLTILGKTALDYTNLPYFKNWIVGFTLADGSFFMKINNDGCYQLKQKIHTSLFEAFKLIFDSRKKIGIEKELYNQFSVSSKDDIQKVINFFSFSGLHPLIGMKGIQYLKWLDSLRNSSRYKNLNFPQ